MRLLRALVLCSALRALIQPKTKENGRNLWEYWQLGEKSQNLGFQAKIIFSYD